MAWIEKRGEMYRINFRYGGRHFSRSLKTGDESKAEGLRLRVEETLSDLERGRLQLPPEADLAPFCSPMARSRSAHNPSSRQRHCPSLREERAGGKIPLGSAVRGPFCFRLCKDA